MKRLICLFAFALGVTSPSAIAAEFQGQVIDGVKLSATASSLETGGVFDIQVKFQGRRATMFFRNGGQQRIRLNRRVITDPRAIAGFGRPFNFSLGGVFNAGLSDGRDLTNLEPSLQRQFSGHWLISLSDEALQSLQTAHERSRSPDAETRHDNEESLNNNFSPQKEWENSEDGMAIKNETTTSH